MNRYLRTARSLMLAALAIVVALLLTPHPKKIAPHHHSNHDIPSESLSDQALAAQQASQPSPAQVIPSPATASVVVQDNVIMLQDAFNETVLASNKPVVVDFYADWCSVCSVMKPIFRAAAQDTSIKDAVLFVEANVDVFNEQANAYNISGIPTFILFKDGKQAGSIIGFKSQEQLVKGIKETFGL